MATEDDVRRICLALPGVTERSSWNQPAWFAKCELPEESYRMAGGRGS